MVKPILFNTEMVRAILDGRKTVTRRCVKHNVDAILHSPYHTEHPEVPDNVLIEKLCQAPYQSGDILYIRETWNYGYIESSDIPESREAWFEPVCSDYGDYIRALSGYFYKADEDAPGKEIGMFWRPSIHMPKEAARIWLKITDVRVERLQDITEEQAKTEGAVDNTAREDFINIWDSTIKKSDLDRYGWDENPWVWVIEFERCEKPEN